MKNKIQGLSDPDHISDQDRDRDEKIPGPAVLSWYRTFVSGRRFVSSPHRKNPVVAEGRSKSRLWAMTGADRSTSALNCGSTLWSDTPSAFARPVVMPWIFAES